MQEELLDYFQKQHHHLGHYMSLCLKTQDDEVFHQLRVSIKRIRAILLFAEQLAGNKVFEADSHYNSLRQLFRMAGDIRDIQVQMKLVAEYADKFSTSFSLYLEHLDKLVKRSILKLSGNLEQENIQNSLTSIHNIIKTQLSALTGDEIKTKAFELLASQYVTLRSKLSAIPSNKQLHQIRIIIKQVRYIMGVMRKSDPLAKSFPISLASLTETEVLIGKWHDTIVGIELLNDFRKKKREHEAETENYKLLAIALDVDQRILRAQIRRSLEKNLKI